MDEESKMNKKILIGSILAVVLLTLVSFSNVVGYNTIKTSQEELIESEYSFDECKDYLFQTIVEISDNPDIKEIIMSNYKPQRTILPFRRNNMDLKVEHLELLYELGLKIIDRLDKDKVEKLIEDIEIEKTEYLDEIDSIIMVNDELRERIYTLTEMNGYKLSWDGLRENPVICIILLVTLLAFGSISLFPLIIAQSCIISGNWLPAMIVGLIFSPFILTTIIIFLLFAYFNCVSFYPYL